MGEASQFVAEQLRELVGFLEAQTGRPFDCDALGEIMTYIKRAAELRREGLDLCKAKPAPGDVLGLDRQRRPDQLPARRPGARRLLRRRSRTRSQQRVDDGVSGGPGREYRLYFDGIMNWNKLGWLSRKFAEHDAAVLAGRYTHNAFWQEPQLIDTEDPLLRDGPALPAVPDQPRHRRRSTS